MANLERIDGLRAFLQRMTTVDDFNIKINAWVFVWYPTSANVGHVSMFIGKIVHGGAYVSWWPGYEDNKIFFRRYPAAISAGYENDCESEGSEPDVIFGIKSLNELAMIQAWRDICHSKDSPSFRTLSKNCANIVGKVLKAGLVNSPLRHKLFGINDGNFYIPTPKRIAVVCNNLRDHNLAVKIRLSPKTRNLNPFNIALRLR
ncbi:hypothetical protein GE278_13425 [Enterobacteriaceae bacterium Kacie_13]|nr:hypothetical protein GE278_13425 [Enterobacteriaceae bacterium Kacie_13]